MTEKAIETDENKHITLDKAIDRLDELVDQAEELHSAITGCEDASGEEMKKCAPSLEAVLNNGPGRIESRIEEISACLNKIRNSLF